MSLHEEFTLNTTQIGNTVNKMIKQAGLVALQTVGSRPVGVCACEAHLIWEPLVTAGPQPSLCLFVQTAVKRDPGDSRLGGIRKNGW